MKFEELATDHPMLVETRKQIGQAFDTDIGEPKGYMVIDTKYGNKLYKVMVSYPYRNEPDTATATYVTISDYPTPNKDPKDRVCFEITKGLGLDENKCREVTYKHHSKVRHLFKGVRRFIFNADENVLKILEKEGIICK